MKENSSSDSRTPTRSTARVMVTGANRGLGFEFTKHYLCNGWHVVAACRDVENAVELKALEHDFGGNLSIEALDITSEASIAQLAGRCSRARWQFDLVISNAGVSINEPFGLWSMTGFERNLTVNTIGPALFAQAMAPMVVPGAKLVQLSSGLGSLQKQINPGGPLDAYAVSKAGLNMLTRRLAAHLAAQNITVISISPGWARTDMGGAAAPLSPREAVAIMTATIEGVTLEQSGGFMGNDGAPIPF